MALTANLRTSIMDFRGFDSSIILIMRGGILMSMGNFPESLGQAMLVGIMLIGRLGVTGEHIVRDMSWLCDLCRKSEGVTYSGLSHSYPYPCPSQFVEHL